MERTLDITGQIAIPPGHRIEVTELVDPLVGTAVVASVVDLETGIRYRRASTASGDAVRWLGVVRECTVTFGGPTARTVLSLDRSGPSSTETKIALQDADAAADAAKAEADRWGGSDRRPVEETERFW